MHNVAIGSSAGWHLAGCSCGWVAPKPRNLKVVAQADAAQHRNNNLAVADWRPPACQEPDCPVCSSH